MFVVRRKGWELPERLATPESEWLSRRQFVSGGVGLVAGLCGLLAPRAADAAFSLAADLYPAQRNGRYAVDRPLTPELIATTYNNFYEFGSHKSIARAAQALKIRPWELRIEGLVERPFTTSVDDLIGRMALEERVYRFRSVEGWSMAVPWTGFAFADLLRATRPLSAAKYVRLEAFFDPAMAGGQKQFWLPWPYVEGLTIAEAGNDLAFLVTGAYGKPLAKSMGAPLRLHCPWKYGFKAIKSISRIVFTDERPTTFWQQIANDECGFWANINPEVHHRRWNQATEQDLATHERLPTRLFNGYAEFVAGLYKGLEKEPLYV
jgi:sulfoxide reductase catalytic subunit YedY